MAGLKVPDKKYVGRFRGEPGLETTRVRVGGHEGAPPERVATPRTTSAAPRATGSARPKPPRRRGQAADHPWHHVVETHGVYRQLAKDRRAWERIQP